MKNKFKILIILLSFLLTGCWDYVGLNEITIVTGVAIDKDDKNNNYKLAFEIVDIEASSKEKNPQPKIIESKGTTIYDAVKNAKKRVSHKLYFSDAQVIVISEEVASKIGILPVMNWFLRDIEIRETMNVVIAQGKSAKDLLNSKGITNQIVSFELKRILRRDQNITLASNDIQLYNIYNELKSPGLSVVLPAIHQAKNDGKEICELNGLATFKKDKFNKYLSYDESKYYLFLINHVEDGILTFSSKDNKQKDISFEISENNTKISYKYEKNKVKMFIDIKVEGNIDEYNSQKEMLEDKIIKELETKMSKQLTSKIKSIIKKAQNEHYGDIFGFGNTIYKTNPRLWNKLSKHWDETFSNLDFDIKTNVIIQNTAFLR